ncbi:MAG: hypothetical protein A2107_07365 [Verrucomicrobia bacterium GWF2_62_7]|nr:MAG: hypothetical protein A2107_07365 [Verrucomicrobia bacterium GWF2_62_7]
MGTVIELANGDLILPGYFNLHGATGEKKEQCGSGFFRSVDGGKTWGTFEVAFKDPPEGRDLPNNFNQAAYVVRADGSLVACARSDSVNLRSGKFLPQGNNLWFTESSDQGKTWASPKEAMIGGIGPAMVRMGQDKYLLVCGDREPIRKVKFYTSRNGRDFVFARYAPYQRTGGICDGAGTGGTQRILPLDAKRVYVIYYATDHRLKTFWNTYIEGCLLQLE